MEIESNCFEKFFTQLVRQGTGELELVGNVHRSALLSLQPQSHRSVICFTLITTSITQLRNRTIHVKRSYTFVHMQIWLKVGK